MDLYEQRVVKYIPIYLRFTKFTPTELSKYKCVFINLPWKFKGKRNVSK